ncbi:hypothetical protein ACO0SA_003120 [Hanseniaspora valbyensis]
MATSSLFDYSGGGYGIGASLMQKMGFKMGSGLGKHNQGITVPVEADLSLKKGAGIGMNAIAKKSQEREERIVVVISDDEDKILDPVMFDKKIKPDIKETQRLINDDFIKVKKELEELGIDTSIVDDLVSKGIVEMKKFLLKKRLLNKKKSNVIVKDQEVKIPTTKKLESNPEINLYKEKLTHIESIKKNILKLKQQYSYDDLVKAIEFIDVQLVEQELDLILANIMFEFKDKILESDKGLKLISFLCTYILTYDIDSNNFETSKNFIHKVSYKKYCVQYIEKFETQVSLILKSDETSLFEFIKDLPNFQDISIILTLLGFSGHITTTVIVPKIINILNHIKQKCDNKVIFQKSNIKILCESLQNSIDDNLDVKYFSKLIYKMIDFLEAILKRELFTKKLTNIEKINSISILMKEFNYMIKCDNATLKLFNEKIEDELFYESILKPNYSLFIDDLSTFITLVNQLNIDLRATIISEYLMNYEADPLFTLDSLHDDLQIPDVDFLQILPKLEKLIKKDTEKNKQKPITVTNKSELIKACNNIGYILDKIVSDGYNGPMYTIMNPQSGVSKNVVIERNMICQLNSTGDITPLTTDFRDIIRMLSI